MSVDDQLIFVLHILVPKEVDMEIRDILLISFLYLAGLFFIGIGIMKPDIFYAALGALGITGATMC